MSDQDKAKPLRIPLEEAKERYDEEEVTVLDVVDPRSYEQLSQQIEGAVRIDPREISDEFNRIPEDETVLAY
jgi:rhodanese-related sulfurtransferase